ncbi:hypothetical protein ACFYWN_40175 [Streptomyces sp. NPDC002917]|uniref:hypothetical protein n=1 Tax=Streptomyces sp. NPDC002917 TaxID=3364671 RepID=UPI00367EA060
MRFGFIMFPTQDAIPPARKPGTDESIPVTLFGGELDDVDVDVYAAAGADRVLFWVSSQDTAGMTTTVDHIALSLGSRLR